MSILEWDLPNMFDFHSIWSNTEDANRLLDYTIHWFYNVLDLCLISFLWLRLLSQFHFRIPKDHSNHAKLKLK